MRKVILKVIPVATNEDVASKGFSLNYRTEFLALVSRFPEGINLELIRQLKSINLKLRNAKDADTVYFEENEWAFLKDRLASARFQFYAEELIQMADDLSNAPDVEDAVKG